MRFGAVDDKSRNRVSQRNSVSKILIIGYGNRLRGDDALGLEMAARLARRFAADPRVTVQSIPQLTLDLAETIANFSGVILIDARHAEPVGEIFIQEIQPTQKLPQPFSHYLSPDELLVVCQNLYGARPTVILIGINASQFEAGESISSAVLNRMDDLVAQVEMIVRNDFG
jgi:hydrogenase maturation protease